MTRTFAMWLCLTGVPLASAFDSDGDGIEDSSDLCPTQNALYTDDDGTGTLDGCVDNPSAYVWPDDITDPFDTAQGAVLSWDSGFQFAANVFGRSAGFTESIPPYGVLYPAFSAGGVNAGVTSGIRVQTAHAVRLRGFELLSAHDGQPALSRAMTDFRLSADTDANGSYETTVAARAIDPDYAAGAFASSQLPNSLHMQLILDEPVTSDRWQLEVTTHAGGQHSGVRIMELDAIGDFDRDRDGAVDSVDLLPTDPSGCGDSDADGCDDCANTIAPSPEFDGPDLDGDGLCDSGDADQDGDGVADAADAAPRDPFRCADSDEDGCDDCAVLGTPDVSDDGPDTDSNGVCDTPTAPDECPSEPEQSVAGDCGCGFRDVLPGVDRGCVAWSANVGPGVLIEDDVFVMPYATVGAGSRLRAGSTIGARARVGSGADIGSDASIGRRASVGSDVTVGADGIVGRSATIGDRTTLGANVLLGYASRIGSDAVCGAATVVGSLVTIGDRARLAPGGSATVARSATIGAAAQLAPGVVIGPDTSVGGTSRIGASTRMRKNVIVGAGAVVGSGGRIGRDANIGDAANLGDGVRLQSGATVAAGLCLANDAIVDRNAAGGLACD